MYHLRSLLEQSPADAVFAMSEQWDSFWCERAIACLKLRLDAAREREANARAAEDRRIEKLLKQWEIEDAALGAKR